MGKNNWKEGWIEEDKNKINTRETEIFNDKCKVDMKTKTETKIIIDFAVEHTEATDRNIAEL